jgi:hypothetical protein
VLEHQRDVPGRAREDADRVLGVGERYRAGLRDPAQRRLEACDAAQGSRDTDRPACVGRDRERDRTGSNGRGSASRGAAGDPRRVPRIAHVAEVRIDSGRCIGELVEVERAEPDRPSLVQPVEHGRVARRELECHAARANRRRHAAVDEYVLVRVGHAVEWSSSPRPLARRRALGGVGVERNEAVQDGIDLTRPNGERLDDLDGSELTRPDRRDELLDAERPDLGQPRASAASRRRNS